MSVSHASSRGQLVISDLSWSTPDGHSLFSHLDLVFGAERTGLVGRNGVGKSTLLKLIAGDLSPQAGSIACTGRLGVLRQEVQVAVDATIADLFDIAPALRILRRAAVGEADIAELADADWTLEARLAAALAGVGLSADADTRLASLSGGQRTRAALAALVFAEPAFILLDEPTNNLDRAGRQRVLELLEAWRGGALVVSHDRELLETMNAIVELTALGASRYAGGWTDYRDMKELELAAARHDLADAERRVAEVDRGAQATLERKAHKDAAGKRKGARGDLPRIVLGGMKRRAENTSGANARLAERRRVDALEAAANARRRIEVLEPLTATLPPTGLAAGKTVVRVDRVSAGYEPRRSIVENLSFAIIGPERVAVDGPNGSGKTTLLALLTGVLAPWSGSVEVAVPFALLDQRVGLLDPNASIRDNFRRLNPDSDENGCRAALARFLFRADAALQVAGTLSGGQLLRAGLACTMGGACPPSLLLLDEPTNHLDIDSIAAVEAGLRAYDGALLVVSHDEAFLDAIGIERRIELGASM